MVLESLLSAVQAEQNPKRLVFYGILYSSIAIILSLWIFREQSSLIMVFLTVLATVPLIYNTLKLEEAKDETIESEKTLLKEHWKALSYFMYLFMGFLIAFSLWYVLLPENSVETLFSVQISTIRNINSNMLLASPMSGSFVQQDIFYKIVDNNIKVLLFSILFSFFYGAGAIFILTWNASVISGAIGIYIRNNISDMTSWLGFSQISHYFSIASVGFLRYMTHGVFEIFAYFVGALAGGLISVAIIKNDVYGKKIMHVLKDAFILVILAIVIVFVGAFIEVYITPQLF
ncbi:MAG: stage II sporulation protein M [Nanoarchaeota archaeon]|nr:stage II sporulation protein M [Nanoarchaeota archaeon]